jgi:DNA modification methylase
MHSIDPISIRVSEDRQRTAIDPGRLKELADSIAEHGLLHAIVLEPLPDGRSFQLIAGERRLRAMQMLLGQGHTIRYNAHDFPPGQVPAVLITELSEIARQEVELAENTIRVDLPWQDRAAAIARLHALRQRQNPSHTMRQTAREIGPNPQVENVATAPVSEAIILARHLDDPDVAAAKSSKDALKIVRRKADAERRIELAKTFDLDRVPHTLIQGDAASVLPTLPDGTFDVILTDPPYGIDADSFGDQSGLGHHYDDSLATWERLMDILADEGFRVTKPHAHCYVFCDPRRFDSLSERFSLAGWICWPTPLIWIKNTGMLPRPDYGPRRTYETLLFARKGDRRVVSVQPDTLVYPAERNLQHGAQKPVSVYVDLLRRSVYPGDKVLDPFCGSGTVFPTANLCRCVATGIELNPDFAALATLRMKEEPGTDDDLDIDL